MTEHGGYLVATRTLDVHEVRVWRWHKSREFVDLLLFFRGGVREVGKQWHFQWVSIYELP